jgi:hypothetical protein
MESDWTNLHREMIAVHHLGCYKAIVEFNFESNWVKNWIFSTLFDKLRTAAFDAFKSTTIVYCELD